MGPPPVTVVVPTYNRNELLRRCLKSIGEQDYDGQTEAIVVDSTTSAHARPVVEEFEFADYHLMKDHFPRSAVAFRNAARCRDIGMGVSSGTYIQFLDDDDYLRDDAIRCKVDRIMAADTAGGVYNAIESPDGTVLRPPDECRGNEIRYMLQTLQSPAPPSTLLIERKVALACPAQRIVPHDDLAYLVEVLLRTRLSYIDRPLSIQCRSQGAGFTVASQQGRLETAQRYAGLSTQILTGKQQMEANQKYERLREFTIILENTASNPFVNE